MPGKVAEGKGDLKGLAGYRPQFPLLLKSDSFGSHTTFPPAHWRQATAGPEDPTAACMLENPPCYSNNVKSSLPVWDLALGSPHHSPHLLGSRKVAPGLWNVGGNGRWWEVPEHTPTEDWMLFHM